MLSPEETVSRRFPADNDSCNGGDDSGADLKFFTKPEAGSIAERMRITSDGNVGIGTTSPDRAVTIYRSGGIGARLDFQTNDTGTGDGNGTEIGVYQNNMKIQLVPFILLRTGPETMPKL